MDGNVPKTLHPVSFFCFFLRWKVRAPCWHRIHPQRRRPRVRERDGGGRGGAAKAANRPDKTSRRTPQSLQLERPPPRHRRSPRAPLNPQHTCPLSRLCTHRERRCPSSQFNYKQKPTNKHCSRRCLWGAWAIEWGGLKGMDEIHTHTHHILRTAWGAAGKLASTPPTPPHPSFSARGDETPVPTQAPVTYHTHSALIASPAQIS